jgi:hypothetical protein
MTIHLQQTYEITQPELVEGGGAGSVDTFGSGTG